MRFEFEIILDYIFEIILHYIEQFCCRYRPCLLHRLSYGLWQTERVLKRTSIDML